MNVWNVKEEVYANTIDCGVFAKIAEGVVFVNIINGAAFARNVVVEAYVNIET
jgi:hypothetical protein